MKRSFLTLGCLISFFGLAVHSSIALSQSDMIVHGQRLGLQRSMLNSQQYFLPSDQIQKLAVQDLNEAIQFIPGVTVQRSGGLGHQSRFRIRGSETGQVLVLLDGMQMNDPISTSGLFTGDFLSLVNIASIEVIKGPQSLAYGPRALGGVILITTRSGQELAPYQSQAEFSLEGGHQSYLGVDSNIRAHTRDTYGSVAIDYRQTDGFNITSKTSVDNPTREGAQVSTGHAHYGRNFGNIAFHQVLHITKAESDLDKGFGEERDAIGWNQERDEIHTKLHLSTNHLSLFDQTQMGVHFGKIQRKTNSPAQNSLESDQSFDYESKIINIDIFAHKEITTNFESSFALEWLYQKGSFNEDLGMSMVTEKKDKTDQSLGLGAALYYLLPLSQSLQASFSLGARLEEHSAYGTTPQYSLMPSLYFNRINSILNAKMTVGKNNPSLYQLYSQYGNSDLDPEEVISIEINWETELNSLIQFGISIFNNQVKDLIDSFYDDSTEELEYQNLHKWSNKGAELWGHLNLTNSSIQLSSSHIRSNTIIGKIDRPKQTASGRFNYNWSKNLQISTQVFYKSRRVSGSSFSPETLPSYYTLGLGANYSRANSSFAFKVMNALDREYEDIAGYNANERNFRLRYTYRF